MGSAYILINCDLGKEEEVIENLKKIDGVIEAQGTFGAYDILSKVESDDIDKLRDIISNKIRKMDRITSTLTLMTINSQE